MDGGGVNKMIISIDIDKQGKKSDFFCDVHGGSVTKLNLKTEVKRLNNKDGKETNPSSEDLIVISGEKLTPPCAGVSFFPTWDPKNKQGYELGQAKTKDD